MVKIGTGVNNVKPGDRVVGDTGVSCGTCYECVIGSYGKCKNLHAVGTINAIDGRKVPKLSRTLSHCKI
jgi:threonine dehydrogenase-like Zn-dependent dehydrogenase